MSFEPRLVHPVVHPAADAESLTPPISAPNPSDQDSRDDNAGGKHAREGQLRDESTAGENDHFEDQLSHELTLLGKQLGRESIRLANFYPPVADDQAFLEKLSVAQRAPGRRYWFQRVWFRSAAALMLVAVCASFLASPSGDAKNLSLVRVSRDSVQQPAALISASHTAFPASTLSQSDILEEAAAGQSPSLPLMGVTQPVLFMLQDFQGLSGEEIEGLREFERPGTRISL